MYVYDAAGGGWSVARLVAADGVEADDFGQSVAVSSDGSTIVGGAPLADVGDQGFVLVFRVARIILRDIEPDLGEHRGMRATALAGILLFAVPSQAKDADPLSLVGQHLPDAGRGDWASWKLQDNWMIDEDSRYGWVVWTRRGQAAVFLRNGDKVADALRVAVPRGHAIGFACTPAGSAGPDRDVVALVDNPPLPPGARCVFSSARKAWRLDRSRGLIASIRTTGIRCQRECPWD